MSAFDEFWAAYPRREKPIRARQALVKAMKAASLDDILAGVERYKRVLYQRKTPPQFIAHPSSWLNAGRWMDEADVKPDYACPHQPPCGSPTACQNLIAIAAYKAQKGRP